MTFQSVTSGVGTLEYLIVYYFRLSFPSFISKNSRTVVPKKKYDYENSRTVVPIKKCMIPDSLQGIIIITNIHIIEFTIVKVHEMVEIKRSFRLLGVFEMHDSYRFANQMLF